MTGLKSSGPAVQYLAGELPVEGGAVIPLQASHNTVGMRFDIKEADYIHLVKTDASFPLQVFCSLKDTVKMQAIPLEFPQKASNLLHLNCIHVHVLCQKNSS